jgi:sterol 14-demethylase
MPGFPVLGNLLEFNRDRYSLLRRGYDTLGPIFSLRLGPQRAAVLIGPHYHQRFFEETDHALSMAPAYKFLVPMFGEPVGVTAAPEDYQEQRAIFLELFKSANMEGYVQVMVQEVQAWLVTLGTGAPLKSWTVVNAWRTIGPRMPFWRPSFGSALSDRVDRLTRRLEHLGYRVHLELVAAPAA